jgi:dolichol-phosphate mannosyltransferase
MIISVVIPCYNVASHITEVVRNLPVEINYVIMVNDCSKDNTAQAIEHLCAADKRIIYLEHTKNQGVGGAMLTGFKKSIELNSEITIKMDGDNQMDAGYIPALIKPLVDKTADFTKGR